MSTSRAEHWPVSTLDRVVVSVRVVGTEDQIVSLAVGDLNGDGKQDIVASSIDGTYTVLLGTGNNNFTKFSANAGAGLELGGGPVAFFVESRWVNLFTPGRDLRYVPVIAGITIR